MKRLLMIVIPFPSCYNVYLRQTREQGGFIPVLAGFCVHLYAGGEDLIRVSGISKSFRVAKRRAGFRRAVKALVSREHETIQALKDISFDIRDGEMVGYIGPNGAGKSTTIKIMCGVLTPDSGVCDINGRTPWKERVGHAREIGVVFGQRSQLWWDVPVDDSFELIRDIYRVDKAQYMKTRDELVALLGLEDILMTPARSLSLGQRMRCELAASLLHRPRILFLDEPTIGLDAVSKLAVRQFIRRINREEGTTVILTTHDMQDIEALARRIILIGRGRILLDGGLDEIRRHGGDAKTITFEYRGEVPSLCDGMDMLESREGRLAVKLLGDRCGTAQAIAHISSQVELLDLSVASPGAEELVAALYMEYSI